MYVLLYVVRSEGISVGAALRGSGAPDGPTASAAFAGAEAA
jgi:hypothetical protein